MIEEISEGLRQMHWAEGAAVLCGVAYVILAAREHIGCWAFGILNGLLSIYLFYVSGLLAESVLYLYYVLAGIYGWYAWANDHRPADGDANELHVAEWTYLRHTLIIVLGIALSWGVAWVLRTYTSAQMPVIDAHTTVFSFIATWMVTRKILSNWLYWIVIDAVSVWLYASRDLYLYSFLMAGYTILAVWGYISWRRQAYKIHTVA